MPPYWDDGGYEDEYGEDFYEEDNSDNDGYNFYDEELEDDMGALRQACQKAFSIQDLSEDKYDHENEVSEEHESENSEDEDVNVEDHGKENECLSDHGDKHLKDGEEDQSIKFLQDIQKKITSSGKSQYQTALVAQSTMKREHLQDGMDEEDAEIWQAIRNRFWIDMCKSKATSNEGSVLEKNNDNTCKNNVIPQAEFSTRDSVSCGSILETASEQNSTVNQEVFAVDAPRFDQISPNARLIVDVLKKNRSCQRSLQNKLMLLETRIEENVELRKRIKCLADFQTTCKRRLRQHFIQDTYSAIRLISCAKSRSKRLKDAADKVLCRYGGPPENMEVPKYKLVRKAFPDSLERKPWSSKERESLSNGLRQQLQETLVNQAMQNMSQDNNEVSSLLDDQLFAVSKVEIKSENIRSFLPQVDWGQLASTYVPGHSAGDCRARWLSIDDPLINYTRWSKEEDKKLLTILQHSGLHNWVQISHRVGTNRTPAQCLSRFQRSLNANIMKKEWTEEEDQQLRIVVETFGENDWQIVAANMEGRTGTQCLNRWCKSIHPDRKTVGRWTVQEDKQLKLAVMVYGPKTWKKVAAAVQGRTEVQCRERWCNVIDPSLRLEEWTKDEDGKLNAAVSLYGYCWAKIALSVTPRTDNQCWRRWKILHPEKLAAAQKAGKIRKAALISNFVGRRKEKPEIGPGDFLVEEKEGSVFVENEKSPEDLRKFEESSRKSKASPKYPRARKSKTGNNTKIVVSKNKSNASTKRRSCNKSEERKRRNNKKSAPESSKDISTDEENTSDSIDNMSVGKEFANSQVLKSEKSSISHPTSFEIQEHQKKKRLCKNDEPQFEMTAADSEEKKKQDVSCITFSKTKTKPRKGKPQKCDVKQLKISALLKSRKFDLSYFTSEEPERKPRSKQQCKSDVQKLESCRVLRNRKINLSQFDSTEKGSKYESKKLRKSDKQQNKVSRKLRNRKQDASYSSSSKAETKPVRKKQCKRNSEKNSIDQFEQKQPKTPVQRGTSQLINEEPSEDSEIPGQQSERLECNLPHNTSFTMKKEYRSLNKRGKLSKVCKPETPPINDDALANVITKNYDDGCRDEFKNHQHEEDIAHLGEMNELIDTKYTPIAKKPYSRKRKLCTPMLPKTPASCGISQTISDELDEDTAMRFQQSECSGGMLSNKHPFSKRKVDKSFGKGTNLSKPVKPNQLSLNDYGLIHDDFNKNIKVELFGIQSKEAAASLGEQCSSDFTESNTAAIKSSSRKGKDFKSSSKSNQDKDQRKPIEPRSSECDGHAFMAEPTVSNIVEAKKEQMKNPVDNEPVQSCEAMQPTRKDYEKTANFFENNNQRKDSLKTIYKKAKKGLEKNDQTNSSILIGSDGLKNKARKKQSKVANIHQKVFKKEKSASNKNVTICKSSQISMIDSLEMTINNEDIVMSQKVDQRKPKLEWSASQGEQSTMNPSEILHLKETEPSVNLCASEIVFCIPSTQLFVSNRIAKKKEKTTKQNASESKTLFQSHHITVKEELLPASEQNMISNDTNGTMKESGNVLSYGLKSTQQENSSRVIDNKELFQIPIDSCLEDMNSFPNTWQPEILCKNETAKSGDMDEFQTRRRRQSRKSINYRELLKDISFSRYSSK